MVMEISPLIWIVGNFIGAAIGWVLIYLWFKWRF